MDLEPADEGVDRVPSTRRAREGAVAGPYANRAVRAQFERVNRSVHLRM